MLNNPNNRTNANNALVYAYSIKDGKANKIEAFQPGKQLSSNIYQWQHIHYDADNANTYLASYEIQQSTLEALTASETRPRAASLDEGMLLVMRGISESSEDNAEQMASLRVWFNQNMVITCMTQSRTIDAITNLANMLASGICPSNTNDFIVKMIEMVADEISNSVDIIDAALAKHENNINNASEKDTRNHLATLRHKTISLRRYLAPQRDALEVLQHINQTFIEQESFALKQQTDRMTRYVEDLDLARERCILLQETLRNMTAEQQNKRLYLLSLVASIFLPLSFLTGLFGMNVAGLPGTENPNAFTYLSLGMFGLVIIVLMVMYWMRWLQSEK